MTKPGAHSPALLFLLLLLTGGARAGLCFDIVHTTTHEALADNVLAGVTQTIDDGTTPVSTEQAYVHDAVGNLVFDGRYYYIYDAWNRLSFIYDKGNLTAEDFDANGELEGGASPGYWRIRLMYDAFGRTCP